MRRPRIVVVGSINMDLVYRTERLPRPGETVMGQEFQQFPGGKGANQAVGAARLNADVMMVGRVGDDHFGLTLLEGLRQENIDVSHVLQTSGISSGLAVIGVESSAQNSITVIPGANGDVSPDDVLAAEDAFVGTDMLLVQFEIPLTAVLMAMSLGKKHGLKIIVDPAPALAEVPGEILQCDVLCPNETEAEALTGSKIVSRQDAIAAAQQIHVMGPACSIITLGENGVVVCEGPASCEHLPTFQVNAVDTTAAGDAFAAALGVAIAEGQPILKAARFASAAGALATTRAGAQSAMPRRDAVDSMLNGST